MVAYREDVALKRGNNWYIVNILKAKDFLSTPDENIWHLRNHIIYC